MGVTDEQISRVLERGPEGAVDRRQVDLHRRRGARSRIPSTGEIIAEVADASPEQGIEALDAAVAAPADWAATDPRERGEILRKAFELLIERSEDIALLMTLEMGKPLAEARGEVTYGAEFFRWFSEEAVRIAGRYSVAPSGGTRLLTMKQPVGPVYAITPWNFPLAMGTRKIGPALAAGCTVVIKPAAQTPLTTLALAAVLIEAGLPDGVVNVITTSPVRRRVRADHRRPAAAQADLHRVHRGRPEADRAVRASRCSRCRWNWAATPRSWSSATPTWTRPSTARCWPRCATSARPAPRPTGSSCTSPSPTEFSARLAERMGAMTIGRGIDDGVTVGPLVDSAAIDKVTELVADAVDKGATVLTGGTAIDGPGHFYPPTVLDRRADQRQGVPRGDLRAGRADHHLRTDEDGIDKANDTEFGLVAYAFTENLTRAI